MAASPRASKGKNSTRGPYGQYLSSQQGLHGDPFGSFLCRLALLPILDLGTMTLLIGNDTSRLTQLVLLPKKSSRTKLAVREPCDSPTSNRWKNNSSCSRWCRRNCRTCSSFRCAS